MMMRAKTAKFKLEQKVSNVGIWGQDYIMPIYDGLLVLTDTKDPEVIGEILWDSYRLDCYLRLNSEIDLLDYILTYEDFKSFCKTIKKGKYHVRLAHQTVIVKSEK